MNQPQMEIVTKLGPYDVLFGRGSGPNDHEGNVRFRKLVAERKAEYMATNHRMTKAKIAREIVDAVFSQNGRFLKKIEADDARNIGIPDGVEAWTGVDDDTIMEKAKQALRQNTNKNKGAADARTPVGMPPPSAMSMQQQQQQQFPVGNHPGAMAAAQSSGMGYIAEDLEPIPIPSGYATQQQPNSDYPANNAVPSLGYPSDTVIPSPRDQSSDMRSSFGSHHRASFGSHQLTRGGGLGGLNSMKPPAPRSSLRSSVSSSAYRSFLEKSLDMGDLMDSFSRTHLGEERNKDMGASSDTMGTIDPMSVGSQADMSLATMNSSIFSAIPQDEKTKGAKEPRNSFALQNERSFSELEIEEPPSYIQAYNSQPSGVSDFMSSARMGLASDASMTISDLNRNRKQSSPKDAVKQQDRQKQAFQSALGEVEPPDATGIEGMGSSSLNLLKGMLMSQDEIPEGKDFRK
mmetsp:Transcript_22850/g.49857  ORF Transcript_22850/g.49857 Transcript_22850/m.49857 type:complete len:461 (+) Transcript_22850:32-1414(+)|eukprot:CAMPEP_0168737966 /NCGR_PEP_ID=MMETSP0724-20121128/10680_1 /TAXON_ID=265536 /ORGANISM="Amphiprora sp., Strain CCMP467" /LENGTH=460 /DNA_ID=CAMNT_0008785275 /DNA_START=172 /DNA_END=1554 /DNA_ORIENTATION=+